MYRQQRLRVIIDSATREMNVEIVQGLLCEMILGCDWKGLYKLVAQLDQEQEATEALLREKAEGEVSKLKIARRFI